MRKILTMCLLYLALVFTTGCRSMFVADASRSQTPWQSFEEAQTAFDKIVPHQTTVEDLKGLGFDATINIAENDYDNLFLVLPGEPPRLVRLHYR